MSSPRIKLIVAALLCLCLAVIAIIYAFAEPLNTVNPKHLTPALFDRIQTGNTLEQVQRLLPAPRAAQITETVQTNAAGQVVELVWQEFGVMSTYMNFIEFRVTFVNGRVVGKEQRGP